MLIDLCRAVGWMAVSGTIPLDIRRPRLRRQDRCHRGHHLRLHPHNCGFQRREVCWYLFYLTLLSINLAKGKVLSFQIDEIHKSYKIGKVTQ